MFFHSNLSGGEHKGKKVLSRALASRVTVGFSGRVAHTLRWLRKGFMTFTSTKVIHLFDLVNLIAWENLF